MHIDSKALKKAIIMSPLSQKEIALALDVGEPCVSNWVHGKKTPHRKTIHSLAKLLNVSVSTLIIEDEKFPESYDDFKKLLEKEGINMIDIIMAVKSNKNRKENFSNE